MAVSIRILRRKYEMCDIYGSYMVLSQGLQGFIVSLNGILFGMI